MILPDDTKSRLAAEKARDALNRQVREPLAKEKDWSSPGGSNKTVPTGQDHPSYRHDPSTLDGKFRWD